MLRKLATPAVIAFIIFLIATKPDTAAAGGEKALGFLGKLATGAADVLTAWTS
jgi:hypothetical protein